MMTEKLNYDMILQMEQSMKEEEKNCTLNITFNGNVKNLEVEINRLSANKA